MKRSTPEFIQLLARSDNRVTLLAALSTDSWFTCTKLQTETGIPRSTVARILDEFLDAGLVSRENYRYEVTPFGGFVVKRLRSICCSIEAMQQIQLLLTRISNANPDITFTEPSQGEIVTPTSADPGAPARRLADLLHSASRVRLIAPTVVAILDGMEPLTVEGMEAFDVVIPRTAPEVTGGGSVTSYRLRDLLGSRTVRLFSYDGDIAYCAGTIDEIAIVGLIDDAGGIRGYVETSDATLRSWTAGIVEAYQRHAGRVDTGLLRT